MAVDAAGDVFVADYGNNAVKEVLPNGTIKTIGSGFNGPYGVAVDTAGDVFVLARDAYCAVALLHCGCSLFRPVRVDASASRRGAWYYPDIRTVMRVVFGVWRSADLMAWGFIGWPSQSMQFSSIWMAGEYGSRIETRFLPAACSSSMTGPDR